MYVQNVPFGNCGKNLIHCVCSQILLWKFFHAPSLVHLVQIRTRCVKNATRNPTLGTNTTSFSTYDEYLIWFEYSFLSYLYHSCSDEYIRIHVRIKNFTNVTPRKTSSTLLVMDWFQHYGTLYISSSIVVSERHKISPNSQKVSSLFVL